MTSRELDRMEEGRSLRRRIGLLGSIIEATKDGAGVFVNISMGEGFSLSDLTEEDEFAINKKANELKCILEKELLNVLERKVLDLEHEFRML